MNVCVFLDHRFQRTPDGAYWTPTVHPYSFWTRYLTVFETVTVVARVTAVAEVERGALRADGDRVQFAALPSYVGPWQFLTHAASARRAALGAIGHSGAVILRVSSGAANLIHPRLRSTGRPFGVEVINDPYEMFSPGTQTTRLRPLLRWLFPRRLRAQCRGACAAAYVTAGALQRRYPPAAGVFGTHYGDGELPASAFRERPGPFGRVGALPRVVTVAPLGHLNKATDVLIDALALSREQGVDFRLDVVGDGRCRPVLEEQARRLGLTDRVFFAGNVPGVEAVREYLDRADLFALPSRHEGLPRAMIEAMARGLPCIGSDVGGIPELLAPEDMVARNDAAALGVAVRGMLGSAERMAASSRRNYARALEYGDEVLLGRRNEFFGRVRGATENWMLTP